MLKLNIYKSQNEIEKTYEVDGYDIMYGTIEDILGVLDEIDDFSDNMAIFQVINKNRTKLNDLILDIYPDMTVEDLRKIKVKELIPFFMELFDFVRNSFKGNQKN